MRERRNLLSWLVAMPVLVSLLLSAASAVAVERTLLARASKLGVEVYVVSQSENWCTSVVTMHTYAEDPSVYRSPDFESLVSRLGSLIASQCPQTLEMLIQAFDQKTGALALKGVAVAKDDWTLQVLR